MLPFDHVTLDWNPHGQPPLDQFELSGIVNHATRYSQNEAGSWAVAPPAEAFDDAQVVARINDFINSGVSLRRAADVPNRKTFEALVTA